MRLRTAKDRLKVEHSIIGGVREILEALLEARPEIPYGLLQRSDGALDDRHVLEHSVPVRTWLMSLALRRLRRGGCERAPHRLKLLKRLEWILIVRFLDEKAWGKPAVTARYSGASDPR